MVTTIRTNLENTAVGEVDPEARRGAPTDSWPHFLSSLPLLLARVEDRRPRQLVRLGCGPSPAVHLPPINQLVLLESYLVLPSERSHLEVDFALRCFQRLFLPDVATRHCCWHNNRHTSGRSTPVLSY